MDNEDFKKELDELFKLFKLLVEKKSLDDVPGVNKFMIQQFEFFFSNYDTMKDQIAEQLRGQFGENVKEMVKTLVEQLKEELDEDDLLSLTDTEEVKEPVIRIGKHETDISKIDELLKNPNLTESQIDELLDRRAELKGY